MSRRIGQLEDALEVMWIAAGKGGGMGTDASHPLLKRELLAIKVPPDTQNYSKEQRASMLSGSGAGAGGGAGGASGAVGSPRVASGGLNGPGAGRDSGSDENDGDSLKEEELEDDSVAIGLDGVLEGLMNLNLNLSAEEGNERRRGERLGLSTMEVSFSFYLSNYS